jgi:uncharacterized protein (TIGR02996 family)
VDEGQALLRGILAEPEPDAPRLVYADWLDDNGQPERARIVRLGCEREHLPHDDPRRKEIGAEIEALERPHLASWLGPLAPLGCSRNPHVLHEHFHRGLLYWWWVKAGEFVQKEHQKAVCEWFPKFGVHNVFLSGPTRSAAALAKSPALAWTSELTWRQSKADSKSVAALAASPHLGLLSVLDLEGVSCTDAGLRALAESRGLPSLRELSLRACDEDAAFTTFGLLRILNSDNLPALRALKLADDLPRSFNLFDLLRDQAIGRLTKLKLFSVANFSTTMALANNPAASGLRELHVAYGQIDDAGAHFLVESQHLGGLTVLRMKNMNEGSRRLAPEWEEKLRRRFGDVLDFSYHPQVRD